MSAAVYIRTRGAVKRATPVGHGVYRLRSGARVFAARSYRTARDARAAMPD